MDRSQNMGPNYGNFFGAGAVGRQAQALGRGHARRACVRGVPAWQELTGRTRQQAEGRGARRRQQCAGAERAGGLAVGARGARLGAGRAAWARRLAAGCALGPFSIRFDSVFSRVKFFGHCS